MNQDQRRPTTTDDQSETANVPTLDHLIQFARDYPISSMELWIAYVGKLIDRYAEANGEQARVYHGLLYEQRGLIFHLTRPVLLPMVVCQPVRQQSRATDFDRWPGTVAFYWEERC